MSGKTLSNDQFKILLQGGMLTVLVKNEKAKIISNKAGVYITCNQIPDFGTDEPNVLRHLDIFHIRSLQNKCSEAPEWMEKNAMQCLVWMANEINRNRSELDESDLFYEKNHDQFIPVKHKQAMPTNELVKLRSALLFDPFDIQPSTEKGIFVY